MKSYRTLAWRELCVQKVTSILILIAVVLSTVITTVIGQSLGILNAMKEQQAAALAGKKYGSFVQLSEEQLAEEKRHPDVIVVDPPRKGCDEQCLATMLAMRPQIIVYVSCDSATLARDLKVLCEGGYELKKVRVVDQFGHTVHVETVCLLSNRKPDTKVRIDVDLEDYYRIKDSKKNQD